MAAMYLCIICSLEVRSAVVTELLTYRYCHLLKYKTIAFIAKTTVGQTEFVFIKLESQKGRYMTLGNVYEVLRVHPLPEIDIGAMVIVWRVRGKIIRSVLCSIAQ